MTLDYPTLSDANLASLFQQGDDDAMVELFRRHSPAMFRWLTSFFADARLDPEDAEDLVSETFARAISNWRKPETPPIENPKAWLFRTLRNLRTDFFRAQPPRATRAEDAPDPLETAFAEYGNPDTPLRDTDIARVVQASIATLPSSQKDVVFYRNIAQFSGQETADELHLSRAEIDRRNSEGKQNLLDGVHAVVLAKMAPGRCTDFDTRFPTLNVLDHRVRRKIINHKRLCPTCQTIVQDFASAEALLTMVPLTALPLTALPLAGIGGTAAAHAATGAVSHTVSHTATHTAAQTAGHSARKISLETVKKAIVSKIGTGVATAAVVTGAVLLKPDIPKTAVIPTATATPTVVPTATATPTVAPTATATPTVAPTATILLQPDMPKIAVAPTATVAALPSNYLNYGFPAKTRLATYSCANTSMEQLEFPLVADKTAVPNYISLNCENETLTAKFTWNNFPTELDPDPTDTFADRDTFAAPLGSADFEWAAWVNLDGSIGDWVDLAYNKSPDWNYRLSSAIVSTRDIGNDPVSFNADTPLRTTLYAISYQKNNPNCAYRSLLDYYAAKNTEPLTVFTPVATGTTTIDPADGSITLSAHIPGLTRDSRVSISASMPHSNDFSGELHLPHPLKDIIDCSEPLPTPEPR